MLKNQLVSVSYGLGFQLVVSYRSVSYKQGLRVEIIWVKSFPITQLSPEILIQGENRKKHPNFLEANFENF